MSVTMCEINIPDNFHNQNIDKFYQLCNLHPDSQRHSLSCPVILKHLKPGDISTLEQMKYEDVFDSLHDQLQITKVYQSIISTKTTVCVKPISFNINNPLVIALVLRD